MPKLLTVQSLLSRMEKTHSFKMDSSFSSDYFNLAQIPTGQRENEYHSVQTRLFDLESYPQMSASQSYDPWSSENWAALRSNPVSESMTPLHHPGYSPWSVTSLEPHERNPSSRPIVPETPQFPSSSTPHHSAPSIGLLQDAMAQSNLRAPKLHHGDDVLDWQCDPVTSSFYARDFYYRHPAQLETSEGNSLGNFLALRGTPPSPPISISSQQSSSISVNSMGHTDSNSPRTSLGDHNEGDYNADLPYSKLIYRALKEADGHKLSLQKIYEWFTKNTNKGRDNTKGWQNSIRHNLSMNKGFTADKVEGSTGRKPQNLWALTQDAIDRGYVESTTRYRKTNGRKASSNAPALRRQRSGSKGGKATKNATKMRHPAQNERSERHYLFTHNQPQQPQPQPAVDEHYLPTPPPLVGVPHYQVQQAFNGLPMDTRDSSLQQEYDYSDVIGCTSPLLGDNAVFCDVAEPEPNYNPALDMGHMGCWYELRDPIMS